MGRASRIVARGEVEISDSEILETNISSCVSICSYHPKYRIGGITHISSSRKDNTTPSGKYIKKNGYHYADQAVPKLLRLFGGKSKSIRDRSLRIVVTGGVNNEGPILETISYLEKYDFILVGKDINRSYHRHVRFDTAYGIVSIKRKIPYATRESIRKFYLS